MKIFALLAAGLVSVATLAPATASAAPVAGQHVERHTRNTVVRRGPHRPVVRARQVCRNQYRNHRRVRICRTVRR